MKYEVVWSPTAEQQLAGIWMAAPDPVLVTVSADWLEDRLTRDPLRLGDAMESSVHRTAYHAPLGIEFEVIEDDKRVLVHGVFAVE